MTHKSLKAKSQKTRNSKKIMEEESEEDEEIFEDDEDNKQSKPSRKQNVPNKNTRNKSSVIKNVSDDDNDESEDEKLTQKLAKKPSQSMNSSITTDEGSSNLRRSTRATRNTQKMVDDYAPEQKNLIDEEIDSEKNDDSDSEEEQEIQTSKRNSRHQKGGQIVKKVNRLKVEQSNQQKNKKLASQNKKNKKDDDDEDFEFENNSEESEEESNESDGSDESFKGDEEEEDNNKNKRRQQFRQSNSIQFNDTTNENSLNSEGFQDVLKDKNYNFNTSRSRTADQILRSQVEHKRKRQQNLMKDEQNEEYSDEEELNDINDSDNKSYTNKNKRSREEFESCVKNSFIRMPDIDKNTWPKYVGTIQFKAKIQFEIFGYMRKVEFIQMKRWAVKVAQNIKRGDVLEVDFRPIDEKRGLQKTLSLQSSRLHTNIALKGQTFGVFEHDFSEIWNFLAYKNYITLKLYCANNHDDENRIDGNKAFDVIMDVYINQSFVRNPIYQFEKIFHAEDDEMINQNQQKSDEKKKDSSNNAKNNKNKKMKQEDSDEEGSSSESESGSESSEESSGSDEKMKEEEQIPGQRGKKKVKILKKNMNQKELDREWDLDYIKYMKEAIPLFINLMKLKKTIPSLIKQKKKNQFQQMKFLAARRGHATLPPQFILKSQEMKDYYSHDTDLQQQATPLYLLCEQTQKQKDKKNNKKESKKSESKKTESNMQNAEEINIDNLDLDIEYGELKTNTKAELGIDKSNNAQEKDLNEEEAMKLNEKFNNTHESKYYYQSTTPPKMCTELFDYQKQGLSWLLYREGRLSKKDLFKNHPEKFEEDRELNSFYEEIQLPDGYKFYHNVFSGQISHKFVTAKHTFGGILADMMGLGKTLMSLALIHSDLEQRRKLKTYGTLLVLPLTCLGQWIREITKHSLNDSIKVLNYHEKDSRDENIADYDVVIIPYNLLGSEHSENPNGKIFNQKWRRVILDEAQKIKNRKSTIALAAYKLQADYRWALTGTPIENKLDDLYSILHFLRVETFGEWFWWNSYINNSVSSEDQFDLLHQVLKPLILRRTKQSRDKDGNDILELPPKNIHLEKVKLNKSEQKLYDLLHNKSKTIFDELNKNSQAQRNYLHIFQIICKLRQFCVHPSLVFKDIDENKIKNINMLQQRIEEFLNKYKQMAINGDKNDQTEEQSKKGKKNVKEKMIQITEAYKKDLIKQINNGEFQVCLICFDDIQIHSISTCGHILCNTCFNQSVKQRKSCPICRKELTESDLYEVLIEKETDSGDINEEKYDFKDPYKLTGSKVKKILEIIKNIKKKNEKVVVFTQWLGMLNILDEHLQQNDITFERIDGKVKVQDKERILRRFEKDNKNNFREEDVTVLLASIKSASVGLNLVAANHVIICDPWWNPAVEDQAMERVHRIGQTKEVHVYRMICADTIEEKVIELHDKKREMISNALACTDNQRKEGALSDLQFLLN